MAAEIDLPCFPGPLLIQDAPLTETPSQCRLKRSNATTKRHRRRIECNEDAACWVLCRRRSIYCAFLAFASFFSRLRLFASGLASVSNTQSHHLKELE